MKKLVCAYPQGGQTPVHVAGRSGELATVSLQSSPSNSSLTCSSSVVGSLQPAAA